MSPLPSGRSRYADFGVHDGDLSVHDAPISVFTMRRFRCSRWSDFRTEFDEDWFRNPRGLEMVRASIGQSPEVFIAQELAQDALNQYVQELSRRLG